MRAGKQLTAEDIAYWYLRLNGFLLLRNFLVHGDRRGHERTEIDNLGVRFRNRREHIAQPMKDHKWIDGANSTIVVFCDVKKGPQDFNQSWWNREQKVMESFLALVGILPPDCWGRVAQELYEFGHFKRQADDLWITTLLIHEDRNGLVKRHWPAAPRVHLTDALHFIHDRFYGYHSAKEQHGQWQPSGHLLWDRYSDSKHDKSRFVSNVLQEIGAN